MADLRLVAKQLDDDIEYLRKACLDWPAGHAMHIKLKANCDALERGRDWILGKVEAEQGHRMGIVAACGALPPAQVSGAPSP
jgi:hypothetical protein